MEGAAAVEAMGYDACFVTDHPAPDAKWLATGGHHTLDPFVALSFAAAATTRLRVQTHILVLPYRNPLLTAKSILSLDVLSQGRTIIGVASGYLKPEFAALGVEFDERNELTDEAIDIMKQVWEGNAVAYEGLHFRTRGTMMQPRPVQRPHPPLWIGGNSTAAIRRAVDRAQGWVPFPNPAAAVRAVRTPVIGTFEQFAERMVLLPRIRDQRRAHRTTRCVLLPVLDPFRADRFGGVRPGGGDRRAVSARGARGDMVGREYAGRAFTARLPRRRPALRGRGDAPLPHRLTMAAGGTNPLAPRHVSPVPSGHGVATIATRPPAERTIGSHEGAAPAGPRPLRP